MNAQCDCQSLMRERLYRIEQMASRPRPENHAEHAAKASAIVVFPVPPFCPIIAFVYMCEAPQVRLFTR